MLPRVFASSRGGIVLHSPSTKGDSDAPADLSMLCPSAMSVMAEAQGVQSGAVLTDQLMLSICDFFTFPHLCLQ